MLISLIFEQKTTKIPYLKQKKTEKFPSKFLRLLLYEVAIFKIILFIYKGFSYIHQANVIYILSMKEYIHIGEVL